MPHLRRPLRGLVIAALVALPFLMVAHEIRAEQSSVAMLELVSSVAAQTLSPDQIVGARAAPLRAAPTRKTASIGTTRVAAIADAALPTVQRTATFLQAIYVSNRSASNTVCLEFVPWSGSSTCATLCTAASFTCSGATTDGSPVLPGAARSIPVTGEVCPCMVASGASTLVTVEARRAFAGAP
jgi:hypothetical protein